MCNFIIRPIKCYATVDIVSDDNMNDIKAGEAVTVKSINNGDVIVVREGDAVATVPMNVFTHAFSDKDPSKKEKSDGAKTDKK